MYLSRRGRVWYLWYVDEGRKHKVSTRCPLKSDALRFLQDFRIEKHERQRKAKHKSLADFASDFLVYSQGAHSSKTFCMYKTTLREFRQVIPDMPLQKIGVREVEQFVASKKVQVSAASVRSYFVHLASAFETAKRWGHIGTNPFRSVQKPKAPELLPVFLTRKEFDLLLKAVPDVGFRELVFCAVSTGMRLGELLALRGQMWTSLAKLLRSRIRMGLRPRTNERGLYR